MINELKGIGLSENEAKVYMAMLELGPSAVTEIAAKAGINRPTAYFQIDLLKKKGLASTRNRGAKQQFIAESPDGLRTLIQKEAKQLEVKKTELEQLLPELKTMYNLSDDKPVVKFFEGVDGLLKMQEEFLKCKEKKLIGVASLDELFKIFPKHSQEYSDQRIRKKISTRLIYTTSKGKILKEKDKAALRESKYVAPSKLPFSADITVFDDKVAIAALKGKISGTIIQHKEIANSFKALLELAWNTI